MQLVGSDPIIPFGSMLSIPSPTKHKLDNKLGLSQNSRLGPPLSVPCMAKVAISSHRCQNT
jgi:hypothetical protein